ncbi:hypothetical protein N0V82_003073 [Gnomoniopsis sp. IMI 355080]|nr:hypothetical protein N0V82_003073 [Gnomoniopsis sp. IMI 355080]
MDQLDDFDFDPEEVIRYADGGPGLESAPVVGQKHMESSTEDRSDETLLQSEGKFNIEVSPDGDLVYPFDDSNDAILDEANQHASRRSLGHQDPSHGRHGMILKHSNNTASDEEIHDGEENSHQDPCRESYMESPGDVGDFVPCNILQYAERRAGVQTKHDEQFIDWMDDAASEEATHKEQDFWFLQLPEQPLMGSQDSVSKQLARDDGGDISHQELMYEVANEPEMQPSNDPSHERAPGEESDEDSPEAQALNEAIQYAYENDLTVDYLRSSFSITHLLGPLVQSTLPMTNDDGLTDHGHLPDAEIPKPVVLDKSKTLTITPRALHLIAEARSVQNEEVVQSLTDELCNPYRFGPKKLELPTLRTDNERDLKAFQERGLARCDSLMKSIKEHRLPLYPQNLEDGEGMELSYKARAESEMMMNRTEEEKVGATKDLLIYLVSQLKDDYTHDDQMQYMIGEVKYDKARASRLPLVPKIEKVTPPVSPKLVPRHSPPAIDSLQLPSTSDDSSSLLSDNFRAIEDIMLGDHQDVWSADTSPIREFLKIEWDVAGEDTFLERPSQTLEDFKVEVPLMLDRMPPRPKPSGQDEFGQFVEEKMDLDPEFESAVLHEFPDDNMKEQLREQLDEAVQSAMNSIEQEQLQAIDAIGRVPIPVMDFLIPEPAWKRLCGKCHSETSILQWIQAGKEQLFEPPSWPLDRVAQSRMVWNPVAFGAIKVNENEDMHEGESLLEMYLEVPLEHDVQKSLDYICQRGKVAVFEEDDHDEDIESQLRSKRPAVDLANSVKKRSMDTSSGGTPKRPRRHSIEQRSLHQASEASGPSLLAGDSPGASGNLLANFMEVHAPKKRVLTQSKYFASTQSNAPPLSAVTLPLPKQDHTQRSEPPKAGAMAPCPAIKPPATSLTIFISIAIPRRMIRALEGLLPDLTLLERDYDAHNTFNWKPGSVVRTGVVPPLADDADITASPSTGLILTSMIRVRQIPREGTNKGMVQIRVEKASLRYERLVVLVGGDGGKEDVVDVMSSSDSSALLELQGFASGLECNVQVHYVGGGDKTLANWVAAYICRYGLADPQLVAELLEPETLWEVFLRRAGFNVFAAQVVASQFKLPSGKTIAESSAQYGLGAFMTMTRQERMRRFGQLVGSTTMERVSRNVDELWNRG